MKDLADGLSAKIASLVAERGWNQEEFARIAGVSRLTVRNIVGRSRHRLHNDTLAKCAQALGLSVHELSHRPLEELLARQHSGENGSVHVDAVSARKYEEATQPELMDWLERHPERAARISAADMDELLSLQGTGGPLTAEGVEHFIGLIERKRRLLDKVAAIAGTEYIDMLEQLVDLLHEKVQPYRNRKGNTR